MCFAVLPAEVPFPFFDAVVAQSTANGSYAAKGRYTALPPAALLEPPPICERDVRVRDGPLRESAPFLRSGHAQCRRLAYVASTFAPYHATCVYLPPQNTKPAR